MKKFLLLFLLLIFFIPNVNADTIIESVSSSSNIPQLDVIKSYSVHCKDNSVCSLNDAYNELISDFHSQDKPYYSIHMNIYQAYNYLTFDIQYFSDISSYSLDYSGDTHKLSISFDTGKVVFLNRWSDPLTNKFYLLYDTNVDLKSLNLQMSFELNGFYSNDSSDNLILNKNSFPLIKDLINYSSWKDYESDNSSDLTTINLDNYHYVILSLKDYSKSKAFQTTFQIKGSVGFNPVYNYGQIEKETITDRCNLVYDDFTSYPLYILDSDLKNHAVYYLKGCQNNSSVKIDTSIFNITYVTDDNVNDPVITVDGKQYHTIPLDSLTNTVWDNEDNNFIPGESNNAFTDIIDNISEKSEYLWTTLTSFMSLVTRLFNTLPVEFRTILITSFSIMVTLGVIKFIKS